MSFWSSKRVINTCLALILFAGGAVYGILVFRSHWFPHDYLVWIRDRFESRAAAVVEPKSVSTVGTTLLRLRKTVYGLDDSWKLDGYAGGLAALRGVCLGVDRHGQFFVYRSGGDLRKIDLKLDLNLSAYDAFLVELSDDYWWRNSRTKNIAVVGIAVRDLGNSVELYACHDYWIEEVGGKAMRISRLIIEDVEALISGNMVLAENLWESVCQIEPVIPYSEGKDTPFTTAHRGGRMVFNKQGQLIVGMGDREMNGLNGTSQSSQDSESGYGKILEVDITTGDLSIYAYGIRNPQGLFIDRDGVLWETEHGPKGGDELNLMQKGANYGWPLVSFGTDYASYEWPLSTEQGRHDGFVAPVFSWLPSIGISNLIQVQDAPKEWDGDLLIGSLIAQSLYRARLEKGRVVYVEPIKIGERIRDLVQLEVGGFLLWTDSGRLVEIEEISHDEMLFAEPLTDEEREAGLASVLSHCASCHDLTTDPEQTMAPSLWSVYGRRVGSTSFSRYSPAMRSENGIWNEASLRSFLLDPQSMIPGTAMPPTYLDEETIEHLISYMRRLK